MEKRLPKDFEKRLNYLEKDLQNKVKRAVDKEKTLVKCEEISNDEDKKWFIQQHFKLIGNLSKMEYNRIFVQEKWNSDINYKIELVLKIKKMVIENDDKKEYKKQLKALPEIDVEKKKNPLKIKINEKIEEVKFFIFKKTDSKELTEKKWLAIKSISENLRGDIVRIYRLLKYFEIPINIEKRGKNEYIYGVKNLNFKKKRIYIGEKKKFDFEINKYIESQKTK